MTEELNENGECMMDGEFMLKQLSDVLDRDLPIQMACFRCFRSSVAYRATTKTLNIFAFISSVSARSGCEFDRRVAFVAW